MNFKGEYLHMYTITFVCVYVYYLKYFNINCYLYLQCKWKSKLQNIEILSLNVWISKYRNWFTGKLLEY